MSEIGNWFRSLPLFTRYWFGLSVVFPLAGRFGLLNPRYFILDYASFIYHFQFWKPITALFYYPLGPSTGFRYLMNLYFLYNYSIRLETGIFTGRPADYLFLLLFNWICIVIVSLLIDMMLLMDSMIMTVVYIWCQLHKDVIVTFWFGIQLKAMYLPWVLFAFQFIISGGGFDDLIGILVGHLYFFLMFKYPQDFGGRAFLQTPQILYKFFPNQRGMFAGFGQAPTPRRPGGDDDNQPRRRYNWGQGHVLGGN
ncbi:derlin 1 [Tachypleus tridentatus]|uniref:derlin 1 n=1 Tax=Tachypleus tridentatus TaxID=6853 RepID=UPI003FD57448